MLEFRQLTQSFSSPEADTFKDRILNEDDVPDVVCEILDVQTKSDKFGRVLKLPRATVESIYEKYGDPQDRLFAVIDGFVQQAEPPPTWKVIVKALRHPLIGLPQLAQGIEGKHCPLSPQNEGMYLPYQMPLSSTTRTTSCYGTCGIFTPTR